MLRRTTLVAAAALLGATIAPSQALADADVFQFSGDIAFADWDFDDEFNTSVFVAGLDGQIHDSGRPEDFEDAFVSVFQSFCDDKGTEDTSDDEFVFRDFFGFDAETVGVDVDGALKSGTVTIDTTVSGFEFRSDGCDFFPFAEEHSHEEGSLGTFDISFEGTWTGEGQLTVSTGTFHIGRGSDFQFTSTSNERFRDATATGTLSGLEDFGVPTELGQSEFGSLASVRSADVSVG